ncbi:HD domain-containing phosphohydrolase [Opitutus sp. ER46]|uniref:HD domain-containing phosphohydrolase n=1 Tax=Opitutus sp. ER46 TaxID=2161864 RepID=UPI000D2F8740|nr:HD domain-containing phosphohydrolase [Opitutus sp. ER46]PTX96528.1 hypothetical protein DB354_07680 [Opitutus sp. ER46]
MAAPGKILFVDDDPNLLAAFQRNLRKQFTFDTATGALEALQMLKTQGPYALLVVDMRMPEMNGVEFFERARVLAPDAVRIMLTGNADQQTVVHAVNRGQVFRFLNKPCPPEVLVPTLEHGLKQFELLRIERELLEGTLTGVINVLSEVLGMAAPEALGRGQRLRDSMRRFAAAVDASPLWEFEVAALLSSIGYAAFPSRLLLDLSAGQELTLPEEKLLRSAPKIGHDLLNRIPRLEGVARAVLYQHKNYDGTGFPLDDCHGDEIPLASRMLRILADRLVLENDGVVKAPAYEAMAARPGRYDPALLDACFVCFDAYLMQPIAADRPVKMLNIDQLIAGQVVVSDITTHDGIALISAGNHLTEMMLARLLNHRELGEVNEPVCVQDPGPSSTASAPPR